MAKRELYWRRVSKAELLMFLIVRYEIIFTRAHKCHSFVTRVTLDNQGKYSRSIIFRSPKLHRVGGGVDDNDASYLIPVVCCANEVN